MSHWNTWIMSHKVVKIVVKKFNFITKNAKVYRSIHDNISITRNNNKEQNIENKLNKQKLFT